MLKLSLGAALFTLACYQARNDDAPRVFEIPFAVRASELQTFLPADAKPTNYPLIPLYGYKLVYPNPGQWSVLVQEEAPDELLENRVFLIYIGRRLERPCTRADTKALADTLSARYAKSFDASFVSQEQDDSASTLAAASERRLLTAAVRCSFMELGAGLTYFDLDRYRYRQPETIAKMITATLADAKAYRSRTF